MTTPLAYIGQYTQ